MASLWQKTMFYLGLVDDEEIEAAEAAADKDQQAVRTVEPPAPRQVERSQPAQVRSGSSVAGRRVEPPAPVRRRVSENADHAEAGLLVTGGKTTRSFDTPSASEESAVIEARTLSDAQTLADHIREGRAVVLDLRETETAMVRRLVDFSSGLTYALDGRMVKIATGVILVTPEGTTVGVEERRRLAALGLYDTSMARD
ncbi:MAG: cell division protein SepF [Acidimicrobiia bacterium]|nr:cell division protein SepF [Acidimicrobiia bacterium]